MALSFDGCELVRAGGRAGKGRPQATGTHDRGPAPTSKSGEDGTAFAVEALAQAGAVIHVDNSAHAPLNKRPERVWQ